MCMTFIFINPDTTGRYRLIILNNRDEVIDRLTEALKWTNNVLGGVDLQDPAHGTWLGISHQGRIGNLLSITQPVATKKSHAPSRGDIPTQFLRGQQSASDYCDDLTKRAQEYNGFQFLALERNANKSFDMYSVTNLFVNKIEKVRWNKNTVVIGNSPPDHPYKKVVYAQKRFEAFTSQLTDSTTPEEIISQLLAIATDRTKCTPDSQYALQTGAEESYYNNLCSIFVRFPTGGFRYGTRSHSVIIVDNQDNVTFYEKRICEAPEDIEQSRWSEKTEKFKLVDN